MKLTLQLYDSSYTIEENHEDFLADELKEKFSRLLVAAGFSPDAIQTDDAGRYEYIDETEAVVKKSYLEELTEKSKNEV